MAQSVRDGGLPREVFVAPAENSVGLRGIEAQRRTRQLQIARVLRSVEEADGGGDRSQLPARQDGGGVDRERRQVEVRGALGGQGESGGQSQERRVAAGREVDRADQPEGERKIVFGAGGLQDGVGQGGAKQRGPRLGAGV